MNKKTNVLLVFTDQQRFDTVHALGNPVIRTPSLDRLAREGIAYTSAYSPSPVCVPARCSLAYGQYPSTTGCYDNHYHMPSDGRPSIMDALSAAGYRTHGIGKCHFTPDGNALRGFQTRETQEENVRRGDDYMRFIDAQGFGDVLEPNGVRGEMYYVPQVSMMPARLHPTQWTGDRSIAFIEEQAKGDQPWFLFSSFIHPHPPFAPPTPWHKLYRAAMMPLPKVPRDAESLHTFINKVQNRYKYRDQGIDPNLLRCMKAHYYACISFIDWQLGRMLASLEKTGQLDRTLIVFTSDHGEHLGDYNCFGKRSMHDSCARVPMLLRLPGRFEGGRVCDAPASLVDVAPTVLNAALGHAGGMKSDGVDMQDLVNGTCPREAVFSQCARAEDAIYTAVTKDWKYAYSAPDNREFLFDRVGDPGETRNRAGVVFCKDALTAMRGKMTEMLRTGGEAQAKTFGHDLLEAIGFQEAGKETHALDGDTWKVYPRKEMSDDPDTGLLIQDPGGFTLDLPGYTTK